VRISDSGQFLEPVPTCRVDSRGDFTLGADIRMESSPEATSYGGAPWAAADAWYMDLNGVRINGMSSGYNIGVDGALDPQKPASYCSHEVDYFDGTNHWIEYYCETQTGPGESVIRRAIGWGAKMNDPTYLDFLSSFSGDGCWMIIKDFDPYNNPGDPPRKLVMRVCGDAGAIEFTRPIAATTGTSRFDSVEANSLRLRAVVSACDASRRGQLGFVAGAAGEKDAVQVCAKGADGSYSWHPLY
jgi:hypothetical protein